MAKTTKRTWKTAQGETRQAFRVDFSDANGVRQRKQFRTRAAADAFRVQIEGKLAAGTFRAGADKTTVAELMDDYIEHIEGRVLRNEDFSPRHLRNTKAKIKNYILGEQVEARGTRGMVPFREGIGGVTLARLTPAAVDDFRDRLRTAGLSVVTARKVLGVLHAALKFAVRRNLIGANAASGVEVIGPRDEKTNRIHPPTKETVKLLIDVANADFRPLLVFAAASALRSGEIRALRWKNVDLVKGEVKVESAVDDAAKRGDPRKEGKPKSAAGIRTVPIGDSVIIVLQAWKLRSKWSKSDDLVFPNTEGRHRSHTNLLKRSFFPLFETLAKKYMDDPTANPPPPPRCRWHDLRHFGISCWIEAGLPHKAVQEFAGHASLNLTMSTYGHLFKSEDHSRAMSQIAKGLFG